jgi:hypothetical protein
MLIASNEEFSTKDRIDADTASCEVALAIAKLAFEGIFGSKAQKW